MNIVKWTTKADWLTRYLYAHGFWVGGTKVTYQENYLTTATQTIRYFYASRSEFLVVYILEFLEPEDGNQEYQSAIESYLAELLVKPHFTLAIWPSPTLSFSVLEGTNFRQHLDTKGALQAFENFDPTLTGKSSYLKPINRSFTDFFHLWARQNMKGFQNDIDAFIKRDDRVYMIELKRPQENANTWKPYSADSNNYIQFANLCSKFNYELINIAYAEALPGKMKIFKNVNFHNHELHYVSAILNMEPHDEILTEIEKLEFFKEVSKR